MKKEIKYNEIKDGNFTVEFSTAFYKDVQSVYQQILQNNKPEELIKCFHNLKAINSNENVVLNDLESILFIFTTLINAFNKELKDKDLLIEKSKTIDLSEKDQQKLSEFKQNAETFIKENPDFVKLFDKS